MIEQLEKIFERARISMLRDIERAKDFEGYLSAQSLPPVTREGVDFSDRLESNYETFISARDPRLKMALMKVHENEAKFMTEACLQVASMVEMAKTESIKLINKQRSSGISSN